VAAVRHDAGSVCHPLTLLLGWFGFAILLPWIHSRILFAVVVFLGLTAALWYARGRMLALLRRSRWLLLSLGILFAFFTPGEYVPWLPAWLGVTHEGLIAAADHLGRLLTMLATLALVLERLGRRGLLIAFYALLHPFSFRDATVVRLMLVLDHVESRKKLSWREWLSSEVGQQPAAGERMQLPVCGLRARDGVLILLCFLLVGTWIAMA